MFAFGLAGLSLMGVPPSGGFVAKWLLLSAAVVEGQWWWAAVMLAGGLLAGGYVFIVLGKLMGDGADASAADVACASVSRASRGGGARRCAVRRRCSASCRCEPSELLQIGRATVVEVSAR